MIVKRALGAKFGTKTRQTIYEKTNYHCYYCGTALNPENWSVDHIIPISLGGSDELDNLTGACISCNKRKKNHTLESFRTLQSRLNQKIPWFSPDQTKFLERHGFTKHIPSPDLFWWEKQ